jgi:hypothetical protein
MDQTFRPFRLQPPVAASRAWSGFARELTARSIDRIPFGDLGVLWASPFPSRLAATTGRIEFVILRTSRSPPVALHPLSRGRSYFRLQNSDPTSTGTFTLLIRYTYKRTRRRLQSPIASKQPQIGDWSRLLQVCYYPKLNHARQIALTLTLG